MASVLYVSEAILKSLANGVVQFNFVLCKEMLICFIVLNAQLPEIMHETVNQNQEKLEKAKKTVSITLFILNAETVLD